MMKAGVRARRSGNFSRHEAAVFLFQLCSEAMRPQGYEIAGLPFGSGSSALDLACPVKDTIGRG